MHALENVTIDLKHAPPFEVIHRVWYGSGPLTRMEGLVCGCLIFVNSTTVTMRQTGFFNPFDHCGRYAYGHTTSYFLMSLLYRETHPLLTSRAYCTCLLLH